MGSKEDFDELVAELDKNNSSEFLYDNESGIPDFVTAKNGLQREFTNKARIALSSLSSTIHLNNKDISSVIEIKTFIGIVRQCIADYHAETSLAEDTSCEYTELVSRIKLETSRLSKEYTHYFPAWTLGMEKETPFTIGPVTFISREQWIDSVDFPDNAKEKFWNEPEANFKWKEILKDALNNPSSTTPLVGLANNVYGSINKCPSLLKISLKGYEKGLSRKLAELICKTALDSVSLAFGDRAFFHQQALYDERLQPFGSSSLIETNGFLWLPGSSLSDRIPYLDYIRVKNRTEEMSEILDAFGYMLEALVMPERHAYPKLANRWATALDWFGEGNREKNDAIALAKIVSSLDILAKAGGYRPILDMFQHLFQISETTEVIKGKNPKTLKKFVENIYGDGRSKILHGTHYERLKSFSEQRDKAAYFARIALIECAIRLKKYTGDDTDNAFRTIPK
ncbi:HEPN domain-containing protein [Methylovulum miyakonense]|uniref:HEPN domain-containing protein n=1 Tax=Methylovulum miyakonense TaxID=645578 RepID=UPI000372FD06|nr:HEPN domain-containing protein [Methylovulum miyakonense]